MHEISLARRIVEIAEEHAQRDSFCRVSTLRLAVGPFAHVDPRALTQGLEIVSRGTVAEGARVVIERIAGRARCEPCDAEIEVTAYGEPCSRCGGHRWTLLQGDELRVVSMEVS